MKKRIFIMCPDDIKESVMKRAINVYERAAVFTSHLDDADILVVVNQEIGKDKLREAKSRNIRILYVNEQLIERDTYQKICDNQGIINKFL